MQIRPSRAMDETDIGHMGLFWIDGTNAPKFRGFVFNPLELPEAFRAPAQWRDYLFANSCPGHIIRDLYLEDDYFKRRDRLVFRTWAASPLQIAEVHRETC